MICSNADVLNGIKIDTLKYILTHLAWNSSVHGLKYSSMPSPVYEIYLSFCTFAYLASNYTFKSMPIEKHRVLCMYLPYLL